MFECSFMTLVDVILLTSSLTFAMSCYTIISLACKWEDVSAGLVGGLHLKCWQECEFSGERWRVVVCPSRSSSSRVAVSRKFQKYLFLDAKLRYLQITDGVWANLAWKKRDSFSKEWLFCVTKCRHAVVWPESFGFNAIQQLWNHCSLTGLVWLWVNSEVSAGF